MNTSVQDEKSFKKNPAIQLTKINFQQIEVKNIAAYCMVSTTTVRRWLETKKLRSIKLPSNQYRVRLNDFKDFLKRYNIPIKEDFFNLFE